MGYTMDDKVPNTGPVTLGASVTDEAVSKVFRATAADSLTMSVFLEVSSVTVGGGITAKLQSSADGTNFVDSDVSVAITGDGRFRIVHSDTDTHLYPQCRIVATTGAGSAVTFDKVLVSQRL